MAYKIFKSDGTEVIIQNGVSDEPFSIDFVGRNTVNYGATIATTQLHLLENFANNAAPVDPTRGQLWYDTVKRIVCVNNGAPVGTYPANWDRLVSAITVGTAPNILYDIGKATEPYNYIYATGFMGKYAGTIGPVTNDALSPTSFDEIHSKLFYGRFKGTFEGTGEYSRTAGALTSTRNLNATGDATGTAFLNLTTIDPVTPDVPFNINVNSFKPFRISLSNGAQGTSNNITGSGSNPLVTFDIPVTVLPSGHRHTNLPTANTPPTSLTVSSPSNAPATSLAVYFTATNTISGGTATSANSDLIVLNTSTGNGLLNALEFDKQTRTLRHWQAPPGSTNWGSPRTLAYTDSNITGNVTGNVSGSAGSLSPGFAISLSGQATGLSSVSNGAGTINVPVTAIGNAGSATRLQTARTINGVPFDGTANITIPTSAPRAYIAFNGVNGGVYQAENLTISKTGTGAYNIIVDPALRGGPGSWAATVGNVSSGVTEQSAGITSANNTLNIYNCWVSDNSFTWGFSLRAVRSYNVYSVFSAADGDGNATQMFGVTAVDPTYIAVTLY